jgi:hypothetical protein
LIRLILVFLLLTAISCVYHDLDPTTTEVPLVACDTISWSQDVLPLITETCGTKGCHDGKARLDWRDYGTITKFAESTKTTTQDLSMPPDSRLTQKQIQIIVCWVDNGTPNN